MVFDTINEWIQALRHRQPMPSLAPKKVWDTEISHNIMEMQITRDDETMALQSALLLANDDIEQAHRLAQEIHTPTGSYLHGIMHRMEGDYENATYWFSRVGLHPCYVQIASELGITSDLTNILDKGSWDPIRFTQEVKRVAQIPDLIPHHQVREKTTNWTSEHLQRIQHVEIWQVLAYCLQAVR